MYQCKFRITLSGPHHSQSQAATVRASKGVRALPADGQLWPNPITKCILVTVALSGTMSWQNNIFQHPLLAIYSTCTYIYLTIYFAKNRKSNQICWAILKGRIPVFSANLRSHGCRILLNNNTCIVKYELYIYKYQIYIYI